MVFCVCLVILALVADHVVNSVLALSHRYHVPPAIAGATFAAAATSAPELATNAFSIASAQHGGGEVAASIGLASIFGSAVFNLAVIVGVVGVISAARLDRHEVMREAVAYLVAVVAAIALLSVGATADAFGRGEGLLLIGLYVVYAVWMVRDHRRSGRSSAPPAGDQEAPRFGHPWLVLLVSIAVLVVTCHFLVESTRDLATWVASRLQLDAASSATFIAVTVVAAASSIPDLLTSVAAARRGHARLAVGNAIGSNTFDILVGLGLPSALLGGAPASDLVRYCGLFVLATAVAVPLVLARGWRITRSRGAVLLGIYVAFIALAGGYLALA